jgi:hypothetical protein
LKKPKAIHRSHTLNNTGVVGISFWRGSNWEKARRHSYFVVSLGVRRRPKFNIDTLGKEEAWRRAVRCRAEFENAQRRALEIFSAQSGNPAPGNRGATQQREMQYA